MASEHTKLYTILTGLVENDTQLWSKLSTTIDTIGSKRTTNPIYGPDDKVWPSLENLSISGNAAYTDISTLSSALDSYTSGNAVKNKFINIDNKIDSLSSELDNIDLEPIAKNAADISALSSYLSGYTSIAAVSAKFKALEDIIEGESPIEEINIEVPSNDPVISLSKSDRTYTLSSILITSTELDDLNTRVDSIKSEIGS